MRLVGVAGGMRRGRERHPGTHRAMRPLEAREAADCLRGEAELGANPIRPMASRPPELGGDVGDAPAAGEPPPSLDEIVGRSTRPPPVEEQGFHHGEPLGPAPRPRDALVLVRAESAGQLGEIHRAAEERAYGRAEQGPASDRGHGHVDAAL